MRTLSSKLFLWLSFLWLIPCVWADSGVFTASDQSFTMKLPPNFVNKTGGATVLLAIDRVDATLLVVTRSKPTQAKVDKLLLDFASKMPYKVVSSSLGKVGNQAAATFVCEGVLKNQMPDSYQQYQTIMVLVPLTKGLYTFQVHLKRDKLPRLKGLVPRWLAGVHWNG